MKKKESIKISKVMTDKNNEKNKIKDFKRNIFESQIQKSLSNKK